MTGSRLIGLIALCCIGGGLFVLAFILGRNPIAERPELGSRGLQRKLALEKGGLFATFEPLIRLISGWLSGLPIAKRRADIDKDITHAGDWLGLMPNDLIAMAILSSIGMFSAGLLLSYLGDTTAVFAVFAGALGFAMPFMQMSSVGGERFKHINRSLPTAIDLGALCMGAGLDFPGAIRQIVLKSSSKDIILINEFRRILQELELGHTRRKALESFAERCPTESVKDFVGTVVQAEAKGNPLAEILTIQARMLRMRRSVAAEEAAARAGVMMMGPLMLIFVCILLLLMGPLVVRGIVENKV